MIFQVGKRPGHLTALKRRHHGSGEAAPEGIDVEHLKNDSKY